MNTGLEGRAAVVTGAASGIGRAVALALADEGAGVVLLDRERETIAELERADPERLHACHLDVAADDAPATLVNAAQSRFGRLDVLVTSAGIWEMQPLEELDDDEWDRVMAVNLRATFRCARAAIEAMIPAGWGRVITVGSIASRTGGGAPGRAAAYVTSKAGVVGLTRSLANYSGPHGITVNCINPGLIDTPMTRGAFPESTRATIERTPLRRMGTPEEVAAVAVMLASEGAAFVHGAQVDVNGGLALG